MDTTNILHRRVTRRAALAQLAAVALVPPYVRWSRTGKLVTADQFDARVPATWFDLMLRLVRQTPGYTPPVASRAIGCAGLTLYESIVPGMSDHRSLVGAVNALQPIGWRGRSADYHWPSVANAALATSMRALFPTAPASLIAEVNRLELTLDGAVSPGLRRRSAERGRAIADAVFAWSKTDGGHEAYLRNFPSWYTPPAGPGLWEPTPPAYLPALQPGWGDNRCMVLATADACGVEPPLPYSTDEGSAFFAEALEVYDTVNGLTQQQEAIARFWADDPGATATPPGHSVSILTQILRAQDANLALAAEAYARLGLAVCDAFIACWRTKYIHNLVRPITYVRAFIDPVWGDALPVTTPPFPEYTSGHSVQSAAAATLMSSLFGSIPFTDHTHDERGLPARSFASFDEFAEEAAISRLYGGIHFRAAIDQGLGQGRCVGAAIAGLPFAG